jgi:hypothetical protein
MRSLCKRKAQMSASVESVRALTVDDMKALHTLCKGRGAIGARQYVST